MKTLRMGLLMLPCFLWACANGPQSAHTEAPKSVLQITVSGCGDIHNIANMLDEWQYTDFVPSELQVYSLRISPAASSIAILPTRRRGYAREFMVMAKVRDRVYAASHDNPVLDFAEAADSVQLLFINTGNMRATRFCRDSIPFSIALQQKGLPLAISGLMVLDKDGRQQDTTILVVDGARNTSTIQPQIQQRLRSTLEGSLVDRKINFRSLHHNITAKVFSDGWVSVVDHDAKNFWSAIPGQGMRLDIQGRELLVDGRRIVFDANDDDFVNLRSFPEHFFFDIRYATSNNFTSTVLYREPICYLRYVAARDLIAAARDFEKLGYRIKMFDGYRPHQVQFDMWKVCPNPNFLSPPTKGSIHNRGGAVDLTIAYPNGENLDMGTDYDYCGPEAYTTNTNLPDSVLQHRNTLANVLRIHHFNMIRTEWWHFSHSTARNFPLCTFWPDE